MWAVLMAMIPEQFYPILSSAKSPICSSSEPSFQLSLLALPLSKLSQLQPDSNLRRKHTVQLSSTHHISEYSSFSSSLSSSPPQPTLDDRASSTLSWNPRLKVGDGLVCDGTRPIGRHPRLWIWVMPWLLDFCVGWEFVILMLMLMDWNCVFEK